MEIHSCSGVYFTVTGPFEKVAAIDFGLSLLESLRLDSNLANEYLRGIEGRIGILAAIRSNWVDLANMVGKWWLVRKVSKG